MENLEAVYRIYADQLADAGMNRQEERNRICKACRDELGWYYDVNELLKAEDRIRNDRAEYHPIVTQGGLVL